MRQRAASNCAFTCGKVAFSRNLYQKCDKGPQVIAHFCAIFIKNATRPQVMTKLLAEKSDFEQIFIKNATRPQVMAHSLAEKSDFEQIFIKNATRPQVMAHFRAIFIKNATKGRK
jgi:hypothetical protein